MPHRCKHLKKRVVNDTNMLLFKEKLATIDWSVLSDCIDANESYDMFFNKFFDIYNNSNSAFQFKIFVIENLLGSRDHG